LEELGQALVSDVVTVGGVLCLDIDDQSAGKSVKTASSRRTVPIHPELLRLGFERNVGTLDKDGRLFPDLRQDHFGKWTGNFSKWWGRWGAGSRDCGSQEGLPQLRAYVQGSMPPWGNPRGDP
jgi:integrase